MCVRACVCVHLALPVNLLVCINTCHCDILNSPACEGWEEFRSLECV